MTLKIEATSVDSNEEWETPDDFFKKLDEVFHFTLDPCATPENTKVPFSYYTREDDGLSKDWKGHRVFVNPPYSRKVIKDWVKKCCIEGQKKDTVVVMLLPAYTDNRWFHDYIAKYANWLLFVRGRLGFKNPYKPNASKPAYASMVAVIGMEDIPEKEKLEELGLLVKLR